MRTISILVMLISLSVHCSGQSSTLYFFRAKSMLMANSSCRFTINDTLQFILNNGSYHELKTTAETIKIKTSPNNIGVQNLKLEKGKTYYLEVQMKGLNSAEVLSVSEFSGKPIVERLKVDENVREGTTSGESNKVLKVQSIEPLPQTEGDKVKIYLFRPFNVSGVAVMVNIAAADSLFQMKNNSSHVYTTTANEITISTQNNQVNTSNSSLKLKLEKGKVYYVGIIRSGGAVVLTETKEEYARQEMKLK